MYMRYFMSFLLSSGIFIPASTNAENPVQKMAKNFTPPPSIIKSPQPANITPKIVHQAKTPVTFSSPALPTKALSSTRNMNAPLIKNNMGGHTSTQKGIAAGGMRRKPSPPAVNKTPPLTKTFNQTVVKNTPPLVTPRTNTSRQLNKTKQMPATTSTTRHMEKQKTDHNVFAVKKQNDIQLNNAKKVNDKKIAEQKTLETKKLDSKILADKKTVINNKQNITASKKTTGKLRKEPGVASYNGQLKRTRGADWLNGTNSAFLPAQTAGRLSGQKFNSFAAMRRAIWRDISGDPALNRKFSPDDLLLMRAGKAPHAAKPQQRGERKKYELDHSRELRDGGPVYSLDNIRVKTPDAHIRKITRKFKLAADK